MSTVAAPDKLNVDMATVQNVSTVKGRSGAPVRGSALVNRRTELFDPADTINGEEEVIEPRICKSQVDHASASHGDT